MEGDNVNIEVMTTPTLFKEYIWLVNTVNQARNIALSGISKKWLTTDKAFAEEVSRRVNNKRPNMQTSGAFKIEVNPLIPE